MIVELRNAANTATLQWLGAVAPSGAVEIHHLRLTIATNERIRVIAGTAAGAASSLYTATISRRAL